MTYKTIDNALAKTRGNYITLSDIIYGRFFHIKKGYTDLKISGLDLNDALHINNLLDVIGGRKNYSILLRRLISGGKSCGILERLVYNGNRWAYIAGQDYTAELNTIRKILREGM